MMTTAAFRFLVVALAVTSATIGNAAVFTTLYDGVGTPDTQPWLVYAGLGSGSQTPIGSGVQLITDDGASFGYSNYGLLGLKNPLFPMLDRSTGFELAFRAKINSESHSSADRAGTSVILLGSDLKGIELGFWENEIWAQNAPGFTHGAGTAIDTTQTRDYRLQIIGDTYTLFDVNGSLLSGAVQDYTTAMPTPVPNPYVLPNFLFLGDNTSSARADVEFGPISIRTNVTAVPEASCANFLAVCLTPWLLRRIRRRIQWQKQG